MIIPSNALLALLSPPQESQGTREEEGGFGTLLADIEQHTTSLPDQEEAERRALESVLQVLMNIFQSCTPANLSPAASAPGTEESGLVSMRLVGGLSLGLPPARDTAPALWETGEVNLPSGMVSDGAQDIGQLAFPALDGQDTGLSPAAAGAPEHFSWLLHRQESVQDLSGFFMAQPTAALSVSTPIVELGTPSGAPLPATTPSFSRDSVLATADAQFGSPVLLQTSLATAGERHEVVRETLPLSLSPFSAQMSVGNQDAWDGLSGSLLHLPPDSSLLKITPMAPLVGPAVAAPVPLPTIPQAEAVTTSDARGAMALAQEDTVLSEHDAAPASQHMPEGQKRAAEARLSVVPLAIDSALPLASARATSHTPSTEPAITIPPSHSLEDLGRQWPRPLPANTMVLHIEPRELGALLLQVRVNDKRLIASFQAQSSEAETLLRTHLPSLHESLSQHGFEVQPIAITRVAEGLSTHMDAGTGAFAHQHSAFQAFAEDRQATKAGEIQSEVDLQRTPRWPSVQRPRLLDVVI
jgi:Flagellar hook-length control protein FliK